jgi:UDPglucose 6-dehydrogenase
VIDNPEFLREGSAVDDFMTPDRIVVGASSAADAAALLRAFAPLTARRLAARISFINEIAAIAEATGADIEEVRASIGSDARIGRDFLKPGMGYGGSSLPNDVASLSYTPRSSTRCGRRCCRRSSR